MENSVKLSTPAIRHAVQQAALVAARKSGWKRLDRAPILAQFADRAPKSNIYRWIAEARKLPLTRTPEEMLDDAKSGDALLVGSVVREIREAVAPAPGAALARHAMPYALPLPSLGETAAAVVPVPGLMELPLRNASRPRMTRWAKSRGADGDIRNTRLILRAAETLRRSLETAVKLQEAIEDGAEVEQFHRTILEEIAAIDPSVAARIRARLLETNAAYTARTWPCVGRQIGFMRNDDSCSWPLTSPSSCSRWDLARKRGGPALGRAH